MWCSPLQVEFCKAMGAWLLRMTAQLRRLYPTPAPPPADRADAETADDAAGELPKKEEVLSFIKLLRKQAEDALQRDMEVRPQRVEYSTAVLLRDALLTDYLSGCYIPPLRVSCLSSLMVPGQTECKAVGCTRPKCRGNNLRVLKSAAPPGSTKEPLSIEIFHQKTSRFMKDHVSFQLPNDLAVNTNVYRLYARPVLRVDEDNPYLFLDGNGRPFDNTVTISAEWKRIQERYSAPWEPFSGYRFRHIHATTEYAAVLHEVAANLAPLSWDAKMMGNSLEVWQTHYVPQRQSKLSRATVRRLEAWRQQPQQQQQQQQQQGTSQPKRRRLDTAAAGTPGDNPTIAARPVEEPQYMGSRPRSGRPAPVQEGGAWGAAAAGPSKEAPALPVEGIDWVDWDVLDEGEEEALSSDDEMDTDWKVAVEGSEDDSYSDGEVGEDDGSEEAEWESAATSNERGAVVSDEGDAIDSEVDGRADGGDGLVDGEDGEDGAPEVIDLSSGEYDAD